MEVFSNVSGGLKRTQKARHKAQKGDETRSIFDTCVQTDKNMAVIRVLRKRDLNLFLPFLNAILVKVGNKVVFDYSGVFSAFEGTGIDSKFFSTSKDFFACMMMIFFACLVIESLFKKAGSSRCLFSSANS